LQNGGWELETQEEMFYNFTIAREAGVEVRNFLEMPTFVYKHKRHRCAENFSRVKC